MNFGEYVVSSGLLPYFKPDSYTYFKQFGGQNIVEMFDRIGTKDPLIIKSPNPLRIPVFNVYPYDELRHSAPESITSLPRFYELHVENALRRHYTEPFDKNNYHAQRYVDLIFPDLVVSPLCKNEVDYVRDMQELFSTISKTNKFNQGQFTPPFDKCNPVVKELIARFVCDKFLSLLPDPNSEDFINTGYFGIAAGLGAKYNHDKIKQLIQQINPVKDGVNLTDINEIKDYIKDTPFYREMMATNRYLALISALSLMFNCSDMSRVGLYANESSPYLSACKNVISNRDLLSPYTYRTFMKEVSRIYYDLLSNGDRSFMTTPRDESKLLGVCQILNTTQTK